MEISKTPLGEAIINEIVKQGMVQVAHPPIPKDESIVFVWSANSADQLEATVRFWMKTHETT